MVPYKFDITFLPINNRLSLMLCTMQSAWFLGKATEP